MDWSVVVPQSSTVQIVTMVLATIVTAETIRRFVRNRTNSRAPLPPGPTSLPLLGSALSVNASEPWLTYTSWRSKYGDLVYVRLLDTDVIVLNSYSDAVELLEKRSQIYSDRPFIATIEPYGHHTNFAFAPYGPYWKLCRKIVHQSFRAEASLDFRPMQLARARRLVINLIDDPNNYSSHFSTYSSSMAMSAIYDYEVEPRNDPMVKLVDDFFKASLPALTPEKAILLKAFPFLLNVPLWIPGLSRIRYEANNAAVLGRRMVETPYRWVQHRLAGKEHVLSDAMVFNHIQRIQKFDEPQRADYEKALKNASSTVFIGSSEPIVGTLMTFTLAMVQNPRIWKLAQAQIDGVVGTDRLPEFEDRPSLPYVDAIIRETLRWQPVGPVGVPHAVVCNDIYKGYHIPSGATVIANFWAMSRDESRYTNPESFLPERFLDSEGKVADDNPADFTFGFGRRRCPGVYAADAALWSVITTLLATVEFNASKDADGNDLEFEAKFTTGITHAPMPFPCHLIPRGHISRKSIQHYLTK